MQISILIPTEVKTVSPILTPLGILLIVHTVTVMKEIPIAEVYIEIEGE